MRVPRLFLQTPLTLNTEYELEQNVARHVVQVLRLKLGHPLILFNGMGGEYQAELIRVEKRKAWIKVTAFDPVERESPLDLHLAIGLSRGDRMDFAIQKAVEAGVNEITPMNTEHCGVSLNIERMQKRLLHWQSIIQSACEQSGRNHIPKLNTTMQFDQFCMTHQHKLKLVLDPMATLSLSDISSTAPAACILCIGPEGGLSSSEIKLAEARGFIPIKMGTRILRTETAALVAITALQVIWGDLS